MTESKSRLLPTRKVCERYDRCDRTIDRWVEDKQMNFPKPRIIRRRKYWFESELDAFDSAGAVG